MSNDSKFWHFVARSYLKRFGNDNPTLQHFQDMIDLLSKVWLRRDLILSPKLTDREKECLYYASLGYGIKRTAKRMQITEITVNTYRHSIFEKLDCENMSEAVACGIRYGLIPEIPEDDEQDTEEEQDAVARQQNAQDEDEGGSQPCN